MDDTVVAIHQGYEFVFLRGEMDDPPVFGWTEGRGGPDKIADSWTAFVATLVAHVPGES